MGESGMLVYGHQQNYESACGVLLGAPSATIFMLRTSNNITSPCRQVAAHQHCQMSHWQSEGKGERASAK